MLTIIAVFGILIIFGSAYGMANPAGLINFTSRFANRQGYVFGIVVRAVLGVVSILAAPDSLAPMLLYFVGALALLAAVVIMVIGVSGIRRIIDWVAGLPGSVLRAMLTAGMAFGVALIWVTGIV